MKRIQKDSFLLLGYGLIINGCIHSEQLKYINKITKKNEILHKNIYSIILKDESFEDDQVNANIEQLVADLVRKSSSERKKLRKHLLILLCYDGAFDETERKFYHKVFKNDGINEKEVSRYLRRFRRHIHDSGFIHFIKRILSFLPFQISPFLPSKKCTLDQFYQNIREICLGTKDQFKGYNAELTDIFDQYKSRITYIQNQKPTLVLTGQTKSGKTTLFHLLSGTGKELKGNSGPQRTSKCNVITHYRGIDVIDTPGLASGDVKVEQDEKIAFETCEKSDCVLFLIACDSYNGDVKNPCKKIADINKPIYILFNYKNVDWIRPDRNLPEFLNNPSVWKEEFAKKNAEGNIQKWVTDLTKFAELHHFSHVIKDRIMYSFLAAAKFKRHQKGVSRIDCYRIYRASDFEQSMHRIYSDFRVKFREYRLIHIFDCALGILSEQETFLQQKRTQLEMQKSELERELERLDHVLQSISEQFRNDSKLKIQEILDSSILQSDEVQKILNRTFRKSYEKDVKNLFVRIEKQIQDELQILSRNEIHRIENEFSFAEKTDSFQMNMGSNPSVASNFHSNGKMNLKTITECYSLPQFLLTVAGFMIGNLPVIITTCITQMVLESFKKNKTTTFSEHKKEQRPVRFQELREICNKISEKYELKINEYTDTVCNEVKSTSNYYKSIQNCQRENQSDIQNNDWNINVLYRARDQLYHVFAAEFLKTVQKKAGYIRYSFNHDPQCESDTIVIYARNCMEYLFQDTKRKIIIQKEGE